MKRVKEIFGLNIANLKKERIEINNSTGVQWDNGHGKTYIIVQYFINMSVRLDYSIKNLSNLNTIETDFIASLRLNANDREIKNQEDKLFNLNKRLIELFNENERKNFHSFTGLYFLDEENDTRTITITYPSQSNVLKLSRINLLMKDENSFDKIFDYLVDEVSIKEKTLISVLSKIETSIIGNEILEVHREESNRQENSSPYLNNKSNFYLGYNSLIDLGIDIITSVSQKENEVVEKGIILKSIEKSYQSNIEDIKNIFDCSNISLILSNHLETKKINVEVLSKIYFNLKKSLELNVEEEFNLLRNIYTLLENKISIFKNNYIQEKELLINKSNILKKEKELLLENKNTFASLIKELINKKETLSSNYKLSISSEEKLKQFINKYVQYDSITKLKVFLGDTIEKLQIDNEDYKEQLRKEKISIEINIKNDEQLISKKNEEVKLLSNKVKRLLEKKETIFNKELPYLMKVYLFLTNKTELLVSEVKDSEISEAISFFEKIESSNNEIFNISNEIINNYNHFLEKNKNENIEDLEIELKNLKENLDLLVNNLNNRKIELNKKTIEFNELSQDITIKQNKLRNYKNDLSEILKLENYISRVSLTELEEKVPESIFLEFENDRNNIIVNSLLYFDNEIKNIEIEINKNKELSIENEKLEKENNLLLEKIESNNNYTSKSIQLNVLDFIVKNEEFTENLNVDLTEYDLMEIEKLDNLIIKIYNNLLSTIKNLVENLYQHITKKYIIDNKELSSFMSKINFTDEKDLFIYKNSIELEILLDSIIKSNQHERTTNLMSLSEKLKIFEGSLEKIEQFIKVDIRKQIKELLTVKSSSGHSYRLKDNEFIKSHFQEEFYSNLFSRIFKVKNSLELEQHNIEEVLNNADIQDIEDLITLLDSITEKSKKNLKESYSEFIKIKTKDFALETDGEASTGNKIILSSKLRNLSLNKNPHFANCLFLDEIANVDTKNIQLLANLDIRNKIILGNQGFDHIRNNIDVMNISYILERTKNRVFIANNVIWKDKD